MRGGTVVRLPERGPRCPTYPRQRDRRVLRRRPVYHDNQCGPTNFTAAGMAAI